MRKKHACVYRFPDRYVVHPLCYDSIGWLVVAGPYIRLPLSASGEDLVEAVSASLAESATAAVLKHRGRPSGAQLRKSAGTRRWDEFDPQAFCSIHLDDVALEIMPMVRNGNGHTALRKKPLVVQPAVPADELAKSLIRAIKLSAAAYRPMRPRGKPMA